jgi:hypothetical protein
LQSGRNYAKFRETTLPPSPGEKDVPLFYAEKNEAAGRGHKVDKFCSDCLVLRRWEDNIKVDLQKWDVGRGMEWIDLAQDMDRWRALVNTIMSLRVP